jgi:hypothetical protein
MKRHSLWAVFAATLLLLTACQGPQLGLSLTATVGTEPDACATESELTLFDGTTHTVYTCYTITNTGDGPVVVHDLSDTLHGIVLRDFEYELAPGASVTTVAAGVTLAAEVSANTVNEAVWDGFASGRRAVTAEASSTVTLVPPLDYAVAVGTFGGDGNQPTVGPFSGNVIVLGVRDLAGDALVEPVDVVITVPGAEPFTYVFDPAEALDGVVALILEDFEPMAAGALAELGLSVATVAPARLAGVATAAALGGDFTFAFPGETIVRTVDATAALAVPEVTEATPDAERDAVAVVFTEDADASVAYQLEVFGTGATAPVGFAADAASGVVVDLSGALAADETFVVDVVALRGELDPFAGGGQFDVAEYVYLSPEAAEE